MAACWPPWDWARRPSSRVLGAWGNVPHGLAWPGVPTGPDEAPFRCLSRAASPRVRKLARTWCLAVLGVAGAFTYLFADRGESCGGRAGVW